MKQNYPPQYQTLFRVLDAIFAVLDFFRMVPWYIWYAIQVAYTQTIYRAVLSIQYKLWQRQLKSR